MQRYFLKESYESKDYFVLEGKTITTLYGL